MWIDRFLRMFDFLSVLLRAGTLTFQTLTIGGIGFLAFVLRPSGPEAPALESVCRSWIRRSAAALAATEALFVCSNLIILTASAGLTFREAVGANLVYAAGLSVVAALSIVYLSSGERVPGGNGSVAMLMPAVLVLV